MKLFRSCSKWPLIMLGCVVVGCASIGARRAQPPATTQASAGARVLKITDGVPIGRFRSGDQEVDLRNRITYQGAADYYFGQADTYDSDGEVTGTIPLIVTSINGVWCALNLEDRRLKDAEWQYVASGPAVGEIWGVLDDVLNHAAKVLLLAHSVDAGKTWTIESVAKPYGAGDFDSFCLDKSGRGRLTVYITPDRKHPRRGGYYHLRTIDGAKTWSAPEHEPDSLQPSDDVPEDEDVAPLKDSAPTQNA